MHLWRSIFPLFYKAYDDTYITIQGGMPKLGVEYDYLERKPTGNEGNQHEANHLDNLKKGRQEEMKCERWWEREWRRKIFPSQRNLGYSEWLPWCVCFQMCQEYGVKKGGKDLPSFSEHIPRNTRCEILPRGYAYSRTSQQDICCGRRVIHYPLKRIKCRVFAFSNKQNAHLLFRLMLMVDVGNVVFSWKDICPQFPHDTCIGSCHNQDRYKEEGYRYKCVVNFLCWMSCNTLRLRGVIVNFSWPCFQTVSFNVVSPLNSHRRSKRKG